MQKSRSNWILFFLITFFTSGIIVMSFAFYRINLVKKQKDARFNLTKIVQTTLKNDYLPNRVFCELLNLSQDRPINFYRFSCRKAKKRLEQFFLVKTADVKKMYPDTVFIDYTIRNPIAFIEDFDNLSIDEEDVVFPFLPYFSQKDLPKFYLGIRSCKIGKLIQSKRLDLAKITLQCMVEYMQIMHLFIDTSKAFDESLGKREVVVTFDEIQKNYKQVHTNAWQLRLNPKKIKSQIHLFLQLKKEMKTSQERRVIDLRMDGLILVPKA